MNKNQRIVLGIGFFLLVICCLYAPWKLYPVRSDTLVETTATPLIYSPLFLEPSPIMGERYVTYLLPNLTETKEVGVYRLDTATLVIEVAMLVVLTVIATLALSKRVSQSESSKPKQELE